MLEDSPPFSPRAAGAVLALAAALLAPAAASAARPQVAEIQEPAVEAAPLNPADVHMVAVFADADGDEHLCTDWEIRSRPSGETAWQAPCAVGQEKVHVHLGDGAFVGAHAGRTSLHHDAEYELRVRMRDDSGVAEEDWSEWATRPFATAPAGAQGSDAAVPWQARAGFAVEVFASGFRLPVSVAAVPEPGPHAGDPLLYVAELYGTIEVVSRDGTVADYASGLLDFDPTGNFPGSGEQGLASIAVDPESGDLFASLVYEDETAAQSPKPHYPKVIRLHSDPRGLEATGQETVLDMEGEQQGASHQVSNLTISPEGLLYVHNGDGGFPAQAQDLDSFRGKVLRMTLDGEPAATNPFRDAGDGVTARDYVYAYGFRNPFGGGWRLADGTLYVVENGPIVDRMAPLLAGEDYGWPLDKTLSAHALYRWLPSHAPIEVELVESLRFGGSGFPPASMGDAFVTESGPTYALGPQANGKRILQVPLTPEGQLAGEPAPLVEYSGVGRATAAGLAAGPDGLYFTDLYKDTGALSPIDPGANLLRVRHCALACPPPPRSESAPGETPLPPQADREPPRIAGFRLERRAFAATGQGSAFLYSLSEPAAVRIELQRILATGRRSRGTLVGPGRQGRNRRPFSGRVDGRPLAPGSYLATIGARDAAGNASPRLSARFRVIAPAPRRRARRSGRQ